MTLALILAVVVLVLATGMPVFAGLGLVAISLLLVVEGGLGGIAEIVFGKLNLYLLVAIPLFAFMAHVLIRARVVDDLYRAAHVLLRHLPGGLAVATVAACTLFAAISGSSVATALTVGAAAIPQMIRYGYPPPVAYGVVAAGGTLGILIPPSGPMVLYGVISDTSIGALFVAGVVPGLLVAALFGGYCMLAAGGERLPRAGSAEILGALRRALWAFSLPPLILGGMYGGVFTATEAAAVGALAALAIATLAYRQLGPRQLLDAARETVRTTSMLFLVLIGAALFSHVLTLMRLPAELVAAVSGAGVSALGFLLAVMAVVFLLGMFLETIAIILITTPIVLPVLEALAIDPVWYGVLLMINLELALITPPVGMNLFVIKGVAEAPLGQVVRGAAPYVGLMLLALVVLLLVPGLALWLPGTMRG